MRSPFIANVFHRFPTPVRRRISRLKERYGAWASKRRLRPIRLDACLLGGDNGVSASNFARMVGDIRRASRIIAEWPHVKLLRQYDLMGERVWERNTFEQTEYYKNAAINIELCGRYFDAVKAEQIQVGARRFVNLYRGVGEAASPQIGQSDVKNLNEHVTVHPIADSAYYQVADGHHRLAIAYTKGIREVRARIESRPVTTPVQELLLNVLWLNGRREIYQPIDSPEVSGWVLVRRCTDRLAMMKEFLHSEGLMPPASTSYLDVACSYGWFVSEFQKMGFHAQGVERDPNAISVGEVIYGLDRHQICRSDAVGFLRSAQVKYDITSCFSLAHHYRLNRLNATAEELVQSLDSATRRVMFFDMGQEHEEFFSGGRLAGWNPDHIHRWLEDNTSFARIVRLGKDEDAVAPFEKSYGRTLFACIR